MSTDLATLDEHIARLEAHCNREIRKLGTWSFNKAKDFENGPLKELKELKRRRAAALRSGK
jgi:hypothetical protein